MDAKTRTLQGGDNMKLTIEVPDTTAAASVTYVYEGNGNEFDEYK